MLNFFDLDHTRAGAFLSSLENIWEFTLKLKEYILETGAALGDDFTKIDVGVWAHASCKIAASAYIAAPTIIFEGAELRHGACIRGGAVIGAGCVVGNSSEVKNSILFDEAKIPHFNYVGDSILGYRAHFGAGVKTANVKADGGEITIETPCGRVNTGLKKLGAFVGDGCEVGCNAVLSPAAVLGSGSRVYPLCLVRGYLPPYHILKRDGIVKIERKT